jgi:nucleolar protein 15
LEQPASEARWNRRISKEEQRRLQRAAKLKKLGYEYEAPKIKALEDVQKPAKLPAAAEPETPAAALEDAKPPERALPATDVVKKSKVMEHASEKKAERKSKASKPKRKAKLSFD